VAPPFALGFHPDSSALRFDGPPGDREAEAASGLSEGARLKGSKIVAISSGESSSQLS
jgi:hypothetical protein